MATLKPKLENLGAKHRHLNSIVKEAIANDTTEIKLENQDINILVQIDIASHKRNVPYILKALQSNDLLYVSRTINKCMWLITDNNYAHIIDPDYLTEHLYPNMMVKAQNKLHKHIRNNIKDELRAEKFYDAEDSIDAALKWLPKCSVPFIEEKVVKHFDNIKKTRLFKRLCERSINILNLIEDGNLTKDRIKAAIYVQKKDVATIINAIDRMPFYGKLNVNKKTTNLIMASYPDKIIENFVKYCKCLDIATFSKYLKPENAKEFIYKQASLLDENQLRFFKSKNIHYFFQRLPEKERFDFVNRVFIDQIHKAPSMNLDDAEMAKMKQLYNIFRCPEYEWYKYAPFEVAFNAIKNVPRDEKYEFLKLLIKCCTQNQTHLQTVLKYYRDKHTKDSNDSKINFIDELLSETKFYCYDDTTWGILDDLFKSLDVYSEPDDDANKYVEVVIIHKLIKNETIEEQLLTRFNFNNTYKEYHNKLKPDERSRIFEFIFNQVLEKVQKFNKIEHEEEFGTMIDALKNVLEILRDWDKELVDYTFVLQKVKDLVEIKRDKSWNRNLSVLYNINKSWKRFMFEESLILDSSEKVCVNALKHDPSLIERYEDKVDHLLIDSKMYLKYFLKKVRVYYPDSLTKGFINKNLIRLEQSSDHDIVVRNLSTLMMQDEILKVVSKYVPKDARINWDEEDGLQFSIRRNLAKNMHFSRPHPPPDAILAFAKGDYLQYAIPSALAIFYNLKASVFRAHIPKLLESPVSVQKLGIHLAITKLQHDDLVKEFHKLWMCTENISIRSVIFQLTFKVFCQQKENHKVHELWNLLKTFIDNLTFKEDKAVYSLMYKTDGVPRSIRADFIERNYIFLESYLVETTDIDEFERYCMEERLILNSTDVMEDMNEDFLVKALGKLIDAKFFCKSTAKRPRRQYLNPCDGIISVLSIYLLCCKDEKKQEEKYSTVLLPILKRALGNLKNEYRWRENIKALLDYLRLNLYQYVLKNNMVIPLKMFLDINHELTKSLNIPEYYTLLTEWKLTVEYVKHLRKTTTTDNNETDKVSIDTAQYGNRCLEILKEDVKKHFSRIYLIFYKVLYDILKDLCIDNERIKIYKNMLSDTEFIEGYLTVINIAAKSYDKNEAWDDILKILESQQSGDVKIHYYYYFNKNRDENY